MAISDYDIALKLQPKHATAYINRGSACGELKKYDEALQAYEKAIEIEPNNHLPYYYIACIYGVRQNLELVCIWLRKAILISRESVELAKTDVEFDSVRNTPEYQALLAEFENVK